MLQALQCINSQLTICLIFCSFVRTRPCAVSTTVRSSRWQWTLVCVSVQNSGPLCSMETTSTSPTCSQSSTRWARSPAFVVARVVIVEGRQFLPCGPYHTTCIGTSFSHVTHDHVHVQMYNCSVCLPRSECIHHSFHLLKHWGRISCVKSQSTFIFFFPRLQLTSLGAAASGLSELIVAINRSQDPYKLSDKIIPHLEILLKVDVNIDKSKQEKVRRRSKGRWLFFFPLRLRAGE